MIKGISILLVLFCFLVSFQSHAQTKPDTLFYAIQPKMIEEASVDTMAIKETEYFVNVHLKEEYRKEFRATNRKKYWYPFGSNMW